MEKLKQLYSEYPCTHHSASTIKILMYLFYFLSIYPSSTISIYLSSTISIYLFIHLSTYLSLYPFIHLCICLSIYLFFYPFINPCYIWKNFKVNCSTPVLSKYFSMYIINQTSTYFMTVFYCSRNYIRQKVRILKIFKDLLNLD